MTEGYVPIEQWATNVIEAMAYANQYACVAMFRYKFGGAFGVLVLWGNIKASNGKYRMQKFVGKLQNVRRSGWFPWWLFLLRSWHLAEYELFVDGHCQFCLIIALELHDHEDSLLHRVAGSWGDCSRC
jgi:hypothetical protein